MGEQLEHQRRRSWGAKWASPTERAKRLQAHKLKRGEVVSEGLDLAEAMPKLSRRRGTPERSRAGASLSALLWKLGRRGRVVLDAYMAAPATPDKQLGDLVGRKASWVRKLKNTGTWRMAGMHLVDLARPGYKLALEQQILDDSLTPLESSENPAALVKSREQAAAILDVQVKPAERVEHEHSGQLDMVHRMAEAAPREALEAFNATGNWDEDKWGPPPWRKQLGS